MQVNDINQDLVSHTGPGRQTHTANSGRSSYVLVPNVSVQEVFGPRS